MKHLSLLCLFILLSLLSCGDDAVPNIDTVPDAHFRWDLNGVEHVATNSQRFSINTDFYYIIGATMAAGPEITIKLNNDNGIPVETGSSLDFDENSPHEFTYNDGMGNVWSSKNTGSSGSLNISSYTKLNNVINVDAFIEGTFSGTLINKNDPLVYKIENGNFAIKENG